MTDASEEVTPSRTVFDRSLKLLFQDVPAAACRLAGAGVDATAITRDDTAVNVPELRADHLELAPLLVLCEDNPVEETLRKERQIIRELPVAPEVRDHLLSVAMLLGARFFSESLLQRVFREDIDMLKELSFVEKWLEECAAEAEAKGEARGEARGEAKGQAIGRIAAAREIALQALRTKFHDLPDWLVAKVENADAAWCEALTLGVITAETLQDLLAQLPDARSSSRS